MTRYFFDILVIAFLLQPLTSEQASIRKQTTNDGQKGGQRSQRVHPFEGSNALLRAHRLSFDAIMAWTITDGSHPFGDYDHCCYFC